MTTPASKECDSPERYRAAGFGGDGRKLLGDGAASAEQGDVHVSEAVLCQLLYCVGVPIPVHRPACRPATKGGGPSMPWRWATSERTLQLEMRHTNASCVKNRFRARLLTYMLTRRGF